MGVNGRLGQVDTTAVDVFVNDDLPGLFRGVGWSVVARKDHLDRLSQDLLLK